MRSARLYAPAIVLMGWAGVFSLLAGVVLVWLAVATTLAAIVLHLIEAA